MNQKRLSWACISILGCLLIGAPADAQIISLNFSENSANQGFVGGELIGPLSTDSANWNNTNGQPDLAAGTLTNLIDSLDGSNTGASVTWNSSNVWLNGDGTANDQARMAVGYLDDGDPDGDGVGVSITFSDIPFTNYRVFGLLASDQGVQYTTRDFTVNGESVFGAATAPAFGTIAESNAQTGRFWSLADGTNRGNYWTHDTTGSTLSITGLPRSGAERASITGVIILDLDAVIFDPLLKLTIDRDTGDATLTNNTGAAVDIAGVGYLSGFGAWNTSAWTSITTTFDEGGGVSNDEWLELSRTPFDLSEATLGTGTLAQGQSISLGTGLWTQFPDESDITFEYLDANTDETITGLVEFIDSDPSNGTSRFQVGDFNFDGQIDALDWPTVRDNFNADLSELSIAASYQFGDINGDGVNDLNDLLQFKTIFEAANGAGSFVALTAGSAVPEPATCVWLLAAVFVVGGRRFARTARMAAVTVVLVAVPGWALAVDSISINFQGNRTDVVVGPAGVTGSTNWNNFAGNVGTAADNLPELINQDGDPTGAGVTWAAATVWGAGPNATEDEKLLGGFLDDNGAAGMHVQVAGIPSATYDVTIFFNWDTATGNGVVGLFDIDVNGTNFTTTGPATIPQVGVIDNGNSITVTGLSGTLTLDSGARTNPGISNITGLEITAPAFLSAADTALSLEVDPNNGNVRIRNTSLLGEAIDLDFFEITSSTNALNESSWSPLGSGTNDGSDWETLGNLDDSILAQFFLDGQGTLASGQSASLGTAYKTGVGEQPLAFRYHDAGSGVTRFGNVVFTTIEGLPGDFNNDGVVDAADYTLWRDNLGAADESAINNNGDGGGVTASDYLVWKNNFGATAGSGSLQTAAVPEPAALGLLLVACGGMALFRTRRKKGVPRMLDKSHHSTAVERVMTLIVAWAVVGSAALAAVTNDRVYLLGEAGLTGDENGSPGAIVGSGHNIVGAGDALDDTGPSGAFFDLTQSGNPVYVDVFSGAKARPGTSPGDLGVQFDGINDVLTAIPLNRPDRVSSLPCCASFPFDYTGITARGLQMWVFPDASALGNGRQGVIQDTFAAGGVSITADGKWTQTNAGHIGSDVGQATVDVVGDTWHHVMHHLFPLPGADRFNAVVYVNGIAVAANDDIVSLGMAPVGSQLAVGAEDTTNDGTPVFGNFFQGAIDNIEMYVFGSNNSADFGTFNLMSDNAWIANEIATNFPGVSGAPIPGDLNLDGVVDDDDVAVFITQWRREKQFQGAHGITTAGDFETWGWGDFNSDGKVNFADWALLRRNHANGANLDLGQLLSSAGVAVPEPSTLVVAVLAAAVPITRRIRRRASLRK